MRYSCSPFHGRIVLIGKTADLYSAFLGSTPSVTSISPLSTPPTPLYDVHHGRFLFSLLVNPRRLPSMAWLTLRLPPRPPLQSTAAVTGLGGSSSKGSTLVIRTQGDLSKNIWNSWGGHSFPPYGLWNPYWGDTPWRTSKRLVGALRGLYRDASRTVGVPWVFVEYPEYDSRPKTTAKTAPLSVR